MWIRAKNRLINSTYISSIEQDGAELYVAMQTNSFYITFESTDAAIKATKNIEYGLSGDYRVIDAEEEIVDEDMERSQGT